MDHDSYAGWRWVKCEPCGHMLFCGPEQTACPSCGMVGLLIPCKTKVDESVKNMCSTEAGDTRPPDSRDAEIATLRRQLAEATAERDATRKALEGLLFFLDVDDGSLRGYPESFMWNEAFEAAHAVLGKDKG